MNNKYNWDEQYADYCEKCAKEHKTPKDYENWFWYGED